MNYEAQVQPQAEAPGKLLNRNFVLLLQAQTISRLGSQVFLTGLQFWIKHATGSAAVMGVLSMVSSLPGVVLMPVGGALADRYPRRWIIILGDLIRGLSILALTGMVMWRPSAVAAILATLFIVSVINGVAASFFSPALTAAIPDIVPQKQVNAANSLGQISMQASQFIGQAIGGVLFRVVGAPILFFVNGLSFLYAAGTETFIQIPQTIPQRKGTWREQFRDFGHEIADGFRYVWARPGLRALLVVSAAASFFTAPILVLMPFYVEDTLQARPDWYGFLLAAYAVGTMLGFVFAGAVRLKPGSRGALMILLTILMPLGTVGLAFVQTTGAALVLMLLGGFASGYIMVNITTLIQVTTPDELRGRVVGLLAALSTALTPISTGLAGIVADLIGKNIPAIFAACGLISAVIAVIVSRNRSYRAIMTTDFGDTRRQGPGQAQPPESNLPAA